MRPVQFILNLINDEIAYTSWESLESIIKENYYNKEEQILCYIHFYERKKDYLDRILNIINTYYTDIELAELLLQYNINSTVHFELIDNDFINLSLDYIFNHNIDSILKKERKDQDEILNLVLDLNIEKAEELDALLKTSRDENIKNIIKDNNLEQLLLFNKKDIQLYINEWLIHYNKDYFNSSLNLDKEFYIKSIDNQIIEYINNNEQEKIIKLLNFVLKYSNIRPIINIQKIQYLPKVVAFLFYKNILDKKEMFNIYNSLINKDTKLLISILIELEKYFPNLYETLLLKKIINKCFVSIKIEEQIIASFIKERWFVKYTKTNSLMANYPNIALKIQELNINFPFYNEDDFNKILQLKKRDIIQIKKNFLISIDLIIKEIKSIGDWSSIDCLNNTYNRLIKDIKLINQYFKNENKYITPSEIKGKVLSELSTFTVDDSSYSGNAKQFLENLGFKLYIEKEVDGLRCKVDSNILYLNFHEYKANLYPIYLSLNNDSWYKKILKQVDRQHEFINAILNYNLEDLNFERVIVTTELSSQTGMSSNVKDVLLQNNQHSSLPNFNIINSPILDLKEMAQDSFVEFNKKMKIIITNYNNKRINGDRTVRPNRCLIQLEDDINSLARGLNGFIQESSIIKNKDKYTIAISLIVSQFKKQKFDNMTHSKELLNLIAKNLLDRIGRLSER